jgi:hypothetical protein
MYLYFMGLMMVYKPTTSDEKNMFPGFLPVRIPTQSASLIPQTYKVVPPSDVCWFINHR